MSAACMGGWCLKRDRCALYSAEGTVIHERLCEPGKLDCFEPAPVTRQAGNWERRAPVAMLRPADVFDGLAA